MALKGLLLFFVWGVLAQTQTPVLKSAIIVSGNKVEAYVRNESDKIPLIRCIMQRRPADVWLYCYKQQAGKEVIFLNALFYNVMDEYLTQNWCATKPNPPACIDITWNHDETWEVHADVSLKFGQFNGF